MQPPLTQSADFDWSLEIKMSHLRRVFKIINKYYSRHFINNLKSNIFQILLKNQKQTVKITNQPQMPYQALMNKQYKTQQDNLEIQFVNMCAQKIQAVFKGFIVRKRHNIAMQRLSAFIVKLKALIKGWKVRKIMRCVKVKEDSNRIKRKRTQIQTLERAQNNQNKRKLAYLKQSLKTELSGFHQSFKELQMQGSWVFEVRQEPKIIRKRVPKVKYQEKYNSQQTQPKLTELTQNEQKPQITQQPKKRVRQTRTRVNKIKQKQKVSTNNDELPIKPATYNEFNSSPSVLQQRPIKAKGAYSLQFENNQFVTTDIAPPRPQKAEPPKEEVDSKKKQITEREKNKLNKRKTYDPRKAVKEEKLKKKELLQKGQEEVKEKVSTNNPKTQKQIENPKKQNENQSKSLKKVKSVTQQNRNTINIPKAKPKVQSKVDCWGNRKTSKRPTIVEQKRQTIRLKVQTPPKYEIQQQIDEIKINKKPINLINKIHMRRIQQKEKLSNSAQRMKYLQQIQAKRQQSQLIQKQIMQKNTQQYSKKHTYEEMKVKANMQNIKQRQRYEQQRRQIYKSIQELENTYENQYKDRYQKLMPKLGLLNAARQQQKHHRILVMNKHDPYVKQKINQCQYFPVFTSTLTKIERYFKQFVST